MTSVAQTTTSVATMSQNSDALSYVGAALSWSTTDSVIEVQLHRGPANEIGLVTLDELEKLADFVTTHDHQAKALVLYSGLDSGFCAGADLAELYRGIVERKANGQSADETTSEISHFISRIHRVFDALDMAPLTTIAAVHGMSFGGGLELMLTCDVVVADKSARFAFPELRLGLIPGFGGIPRLRRDVGNAVIRDLLLSGRSLGAARAHELGLVSQLVARGSALKAARALAKQACRFDADTARMAKRFIKSLPSDELAQERALFCQLVQEPRVEAALERFVNLNTPMPYLP